MLHGVLPTSTHLEPDFKFCIEFNMENSDRVSRELTVGSSVSEQYLAGLVETTASEITGAQEDDGLS